MKSANDVQLEFGVTAEQGQPAAAEGVNEAAVAVVSGRSDSPAIVKRTKPKSAKATNSGNAVVIEALLTFAEAARVLGVSLRQFRRLVDAGRVAFVKVSERSPRVRPSELQRFLDASAVKYEVAS